MNKPCVITYKPFFSNLPGWLVGFAPCEPHAETVICGNYPKQTQTVDALVQLEIFDKGRVYQVPLWNVEVVDTIKEAERICEGRRNGG